MVHVMVVISETATKERLQESMGVLEEVDTRWVTSANEALLILKEQRFELVISDETLPEMTGLQFLNQLVRVNPMVNTALISALTPEAFHEATEGLGLLGQLPLNPGPPHLKELVSRLKTILDLQAPRTQQRK